MNQEIIKTLTEFGMALVDSQHKYFLDASVDNLEHIPAIKSIADTACQYLTANGVNADNSNKVREE